MSNIIRLDHEISSKELSDIKDILVLLSPQWGKSKGVGQKLKEPITIADNQILKVSVSIDICTQPESQEAQTTP